MAIVTFDTHAFIKSLEAKGFTTEQSEGINDALKNALIVTAVTTKRNLIDLEYRLTLKTGAMLIASIGAILALEKLL